MAEYTDKVILELEAKLSKYHADLLSGQRRFDKVMSDMQKGLKNVESQSVLTFSRLSTALTAIGGAIGVAEVIKYADAWTRAENSLAVAGVTGERQKAILDELYESAQRNATPINALADLYGKAAQASDVLGASQAQLTQFADGVAVALRVAGTSSGEAQGALTQLGQALGNSKVQAEEFNSINEGARPILMAVAAGIKETGGSVSRLRAMMLEGNLTSKMFFEGFLEGLPAIQEMADRTSATVAQGFTRIENALTRYIGRMNEGANGTSALIAVMDTLANNFDAIANGALISAGIILARYIPSLVAATAAQVAMIATNPFLLIAAAIGGASAALIAFGDEMKVVESDFATLNDYAAVGFDTLKSLATDASDAVSATFTQLVEFITSALEGVGIAWEDVVSFIKSAANTLIGVHQAIFNTVSTIFTSLPAAVADGVVQAMNGMVALVEAGIQSVVDGVNAAISAISSLGEAFGAAPLSGIGPVNLGRVPNAFEGAAGEMGERIKQGIDDAFDRDYVGEGVKAAEDFATGWQRKANERAANRTVGQLNDILLGSGGEDEGGAPLPPLPGGGGKGKGKKKGGGKGKKPYDFAKDLKELQARTAALQAETKALAELDPLAEDYETQVTKIRTEQELLNKAAEEGIALTPAQKAAISTLAETYAQADEQARKLKESQDQLQQRHQEWVDTEREAMKGFIRDLGEGKSATEALANAVQKLADKLLDLALDNLFGASGDPGFGIVGSLVSGFFGGKRARGGSARKGLPYLVNEETPNSEIFVPSENGAVLNVPQAQDALAKAARVTSAYGSGSPVQPSASRMTVRSEGHFTFNLEGANGDAAIAEAVSAGIRQAAPVLQQQAVGAAVKTISKLSREGSKQVLGIR